MEPKQTHIIDYNHRKYQQTQFVCLNFLSLEKFDDMIWLFSKIPQKSGKNQQKIWSLWLDLQKVLACIYQAHIKAMK